MRRDRRSRSQRGQRRALFRARSAPRDRIVEGFFSAVRDMSGEGGMPRWLGLGLVLGGGLASLAWAQGLAEFDGQYMGELRLTSVIHGDCTPPPLGAIYPLTISGGKVRFVDVARFGTTLTGKVGANGVFHASARARKGSVRMTGRIQANKVTADIVSPSCRYTFATGE
jgi:hypothetical protein